MIEISKEEWNLIENTYKGEWQDYYNEHPEWVGKKLLWVELFLKIHANLENF